jgi:hypothetical protein
MINEVVKTRFIAILRRWKGTGKPVGSLKAGMEIVTLGKDVIPYILALLQADDKTGTKRLWFSILSGITGAYPAVGAFNNTDRLVAWIEWYKTNSVIRPISCCHCRSKDTQIVQTHKVQKKHTVKRGRGRPKKIDSLPINVLEYLCTSCEGRFFVIEDESRVNKEQPLLGPSN